MVSKVRCNTCGVPESEIHFGVCDYCPGDTYCTMIEKDFIEKRVYDYAKKHNLLTHWFKMDMFIPEDIRQKMESPKVAGLAPKYFREAVSCDGLTFDRSVNSLGTPSCGFAGVVLTLSILPLAIWSGGASRLLGNWMG